MQTHRGATGYLVLERIFLIYVSERIREVTWCNKVENFHLQYSFWFDPNTHCIIQLKNSKNQAVKSDSGSI